MWFVCLEAQLQDFPRVTSTFQSSSAYNTVTGFGGNPQCFKPGETLDCWLCEKSGDRWKWSRGLGHELSSPAGTLGSWVWIPLDAWISVSVYYVFVLFCVQIAILRRADLPSKESYRLCTALRHWKSDQGSTKGCTTIDEWMNEKWGDAVSHTIPFRDYSPCANLFVPKLQLVSNKHGRPRA
jgi:hypothetical protein